MMTCSAAVGRRRPTITAYLSGTETHLLVDTGASVSVVSKALMQRVWKNWAALRLPIPQNLKITGAAGSPIKIVDYVELEIMIKGRKMTRPFFVADGLDKLEGILGWDTISEEGMVVDGAKDQVSFKEEEQMTEWSLATLRCKRRVHLEARSIRPVQLVPMHGGRVVPGGAKGICTSVDGPVGLWDGVTEVDKDNTVTISVVNMTDEDLDLRAGDALGNLRNPDFFGEDIFQMNEETINSIFGEIGRDPEEPKRGQTAAISDEDRKNLEMKIEPMIKAPKEWKQRYLDLIMRYHDVVSKDKFDLGKTDVIKHKIVMKDDVPIHGRQFRIPFEHEEVLHDYIDELVKKGAIEPSRSPYNSAVFCVAKKRPPELPDEEPTPLRVVLDYRRVNNHSVPDRYSIRDVRECIDQVGKAGSRIFTTVDLTSGFWQQVLDEASRQYTAFTVPGKGTRYQWTVTPMGLQGSPASFARLMDFVMTGLRNTLTYIDDLLVHGSQHEEHLGQLEEVLLRLRKYGLKLNGEKTIWGADSVQYLGYTMTEEGISPSTCKLKALRDYEPPRTPREVMQFLGLANYFRFMIKDFSKKAAPLNRLTGSRHRWEGGDLPEGARASFSQLREELCREPVVTYPRKGRTFILHTDAARGDANRPGGLGAALFQEQPDGTEKVIGYASRGLKDYERNYNAFLLEMAAAVFGIEYFSVYLRGRRFSLFTDHKPLERLSDTHTRTLNRLQQVMLEYDFTLNYRRGEDNVVADFLSRTAAVAALTDESGSVMEAQDRDEKIRDIKTFLQEGKLPADRQYAMWVKRIAEECFLDKGSLWKSINKAGRRDKVALYAPEEVRKEIIRAAHTPREAGHGGKERTSERIMQAYWWPGLHADVERFIKQCGRCQMSKAVAPPPAPLKSMPIPDVPNERVHLDLFGPLATSDSGNKHILVMTDAFTKYTELAALEDKSATTVARAFLERWIFRFSSPRTVVTDQGKEFCNKILEEVCKLWGIEKKRTSPFHPATNSSAESYNRTMIKYLRAVLDNDSTLEWEKWMPAMQFAYNSHVHRSTKESPFFLTFLHDPRLPYFDIQKPRPMFDRSWAEEKFGEVQEVYLRAKETMEEAKEKRKEYFDKKAIERKFSAGERVLVYFPNLRRTKKANQKFFKKWHLFTVLRTVGDVNVEVRERPNDRPMIIHVNRVKHASIEEIEEELDSNVKERMKQEEERQESEESASSAEEDDEGVVIFGRAKRQGGGAVPPVEGQPEADGGGIQEAGGDVGAGLAPDGGPGGAGTAPIDPWVRFGRALLNREDEPGEGGSRRALRSRGPVEDVPLPKSCLAWGKRRR